MAQRLAPAHCQIGKFKTCPSIDLQNRQRAIRMNVHSLWTFAQMAAALAWRRRKRGAEIETVRLIVISLISDWRMAQLHNRFCGLRAPTDVLTFQHGEIVISAETAARQGRRYRTSTLSELRLYIVHGLLHLCGYDDGTARQSSIMRRVQAELLRQAESACSFEGTFSRGNFRDERVAAPGKKRRRGNRQLGGRSSRTSRSS